MTSQSESELPIPDEDHPLGVTSTHPMWSEDRHEFVVAGQLKPGEHLLQSNGTLAQITRIRPRRGPPVMVYNLEIDSEHVYHVGKLGLLVHNECPFKRYVSSLEAERSVALQGLHLDPKFNGKYKNIADAGSFDPKTLGKKSDKFFPEKITINVRDGARQWLKQNGVVPPLGHTSNTYSLPSELVDAFNKLFVTGVTR